jgi:ATP-dependent Lon protease
MFVNNANGQRGLVCQYDVVCFDEVSGISFDQKDGVNIMKGYMESGEFSRGKESIRADGSHRHGRQLRCRCRAPAAHRPPVPAAAARDARRHRLHGSHPRYLPGWDVPKLNRKSGHQSLRPGQRLPVRVLDPAAEPEPPGELQNRVFFGGALSGRDTNGVNKTSAAC